MDRFISNSDFVFASSSMSDKLTPSVIFLFFYGIGVIILIGILGIWLEKTLRFSTGASVAYFLIMMFGFLAFIIATGN